MKQTDIERWMRKQQKEPIEIQEKRGGYESALLIILPLTDGSYSPEMDGYPADFMKSIEKELDDRFLDYCINRIVAYTEQNGELPYYLNYKNFTDGACYCDGSLISEERLKEIKAKVKAREAGVKYEQDNCNS